MPNKKDFMKNSYNKIKRKNLLINNNNGKLFKILKINYINKN